MSQYAFSMCSSWHGIIVFTKHCATWLIFVFIWWEGHRGQLIELPFFILVHKHSVCCVCSTYRDVKTAKYYRAILAFLITNFSYIKKLNLKRAKSKAKITMWTSLQIGSLNHLRNLYDYILGLIFIFSSLLFSLFNWWSWCHCLWAIWWRQNNMSRYSSDK